MKTGTMTRPSGFTLLEVMLVLVIMGLAVSFVTFTGFGTNSAEELEKQAKRFQVVFDMASDFAVLNQQQLGLRVDKKTNQYLFMVLDDEQRWQLLEGDDLFTGYEVPEPFTFELELDDLPWVEEDSLFDEGVFDERLSLDDDRVEIGQEEEKELPPPQVLLLSSGDITPFSMAFVYEPEFSNEDPVYFRIKASDSLPLEREGPLTRL